MKLTIWFSTFFKKWSYQISTTGNELSDEEIAFCMKITPVEIKSVKRLIDLPEFPEKAFREAFITIV